MIDDGWKMVMMMMNDKLMVIRSDLSWSETWMISRYKNLLDRRDKSMACVQENALADAICETVLQILDPGAPKPKYWKGPDQLLFAGTRANAQPAGEIWGNEPLCYSKNCKIPINCLHKWHLASNVDKNQVPRHSDLWRSFKQPDTYASQHWILEDKHEILLCGA